MSASVTSEEPCTCSADVDLESTAIRPGYLVRRLHQKYIGSFAELCSHFGLTPIQSSMLRELAIRSPQDMTNLSAGVFIDRTTTGQVVLRLEKRGLVTCVTDEHDGRRKMVSISPQGLKIVHEMMHPTAQAHDRLLAPLTKKERERFISLALKILQD